MKFSKRRKEKVKQQILEILGEKLLYTNGVAQKVERDEEFIKKILEELFEEGLVEKITLNEKGTKENIRRTRWIKRGSNTDDTKSII